METEIGIEVERSRRRTLSLVVTREGKAVVRAPYTARDEEIQEFVRRHRRWLNARMRDASCPMPSLGNGAVLTLFGETYPIAEGRTGIRGGTLFLPSAQRELALVRLLRRLARVRMTEMTQRIASENGFRIPAVCISSARTRWGSCNRKGNVTYTFRVAFLPFPLAEYVAVHELCHTRVFDHSPSFWYQVGRILPDYPVRRKLLHRYGWAMKML